MSQSGEPKLTISFGLYVTVCGGGAASVWPSGPLMEPPSQTQPLNQGTTMDQEMINYLLEPIPAGSTVHSQQKCQVDTVEYYLLFHYKASVVIKHKGILVVEWLRHIPQRLQCPVLLQPGTPVAGHPPHSSHVSCVLSHSIYQLRPKCMVVTGCKTKSGSGTVDFNLQTLLQLQYIIVKYKRKPIQTQPAKIQQMKVSMFIPSQVTIRNHSHIMIFYSCTVQNNTADCLHDCFSNSTAEAQS